MTEEDEAFEDLAKRQGDWGMQGSRKHQIMRYAENVENKGTSMTDKKLFRLALDSLEQMKAKANFECWNLDICDEAIAALKERVAQRTEQNFCSRCGKRTPDLITIHTCTPPQENT